MNPIPAINPIAFKNPISVNQNYLNVLHIYNSDNFFGRNYGNELNRIAKSLNYNINITTVDCQSLNNATNMRSLIDKL